MPLDVAKLKRAKLRGDKVIAQCPACAEGGGDKKGEHLVVYKGGEGAFACVVHAGNKEHARRVFELAGVHENDPPTGPQTLPSSSGSSPPQEIDWVAKCQTLVDRHDLLQRLAEWRSWTRDHARLLANAGELGLHEGRIAFPVKQANGAVTGLHVFPWREEKELGVSPWYVTGSGLPLVIGANSLKKVTEVHLCESQWDAHSLLHVKKWDGAPRHTPFVVTRGTSVNPCITEWLDRVTTVVLWPQRDVPKADGRIPSEDWVGQVINRLPASVTNVMRVDTPPGFKDWNDVLREFGIAPTLTLASAAHESAIEIKDRGIAASHGAQVVSDPSQNLPTPEPLPSALLPVRSFHDSWLPSGLRGWIMDISDRMQCPPEFAAVAAMVSMSSVVGTRCAIQPKEVDSGWYEHPHLWGMIVGRPSLMKSPAMQAAMKPLRRLESEAFESYAGMERDRKAAAIKVKLERDSALREARRAQKNKDAEIDYNALVEDLEDERAALRRHIVNDCSIEALGEVLRNNPCGTLLYNDELAGILAMMEKDGNQSLRAFLLGAWCGKDGFTFDRIVRGVRRVEKCAVSVLGGIQPGVVAARIRDAQTNGAGDDGFMQRFSMLVWPDVPSNWQNVDRAPDREREDEAHEVFDTLERLTVATLKHRVPLNADGIPTFGFEPDAQACFTAWHVALHHRLRGGDIAPAMEAHLGKYRKLVPALALLIHLAEWQIGRVSLSALEKAIAWADYLETHAVRAYGSRVLADVERAHRLLKKLKNDSASLPMEFTSREIQRKGWAGLDSTIDVKATCALLSDHGWLLAKPVGSTDSGGRPTVLYRLNPLAKSCDHMENGADKTDRT